MPWTTRDIPDLTGRVAVVTGANGGLGLETVSALAAAGAHVVMAARDPAKTADARAHVLASHPSASLEVVPLDLASQAGTRAAAEQIARSHERIDLLINNAGVMASPEGRTEDGFETQLAVNHLGHWTFTAGLLEPLVHADAARVVTVTSFARLTGRRIDPSNPHLEGRYDDWGAYAQAKLANLHFAYGLERAFRVAGTRARSLAAHPGLARTDLQRRTVREGGGGAAGPFWESVTARYGMPARRAALPQLRAATDPRAAGGRLYGPRWVVTGGAVRLPLYRRIGLTRSIDTLWRVSAELTGITMAIPTASTERGEAQAHDRP